MVYAIIITAKISVLRAGESLAIDSTKTTIVATMPT
jgi:hypothetical protein